MNGVVGFLAGLPSPGTDSIGIGPFELRAYGLMIALGVVAAVWLFGKQLEDSGLGTRDDASSIAVWAVAAGVVGARLYHVVTDWSKYSDDFAAIPRIWEAGSAFRAVSQSGWPSARGSRVDEGSVLRWR